MSGATVTAADIARDRSWSRGHAWRWLKAIRTLHGDSVVWEERGRLVASVAELARVTCPTTEEQLRQALNRIALLESAYRDQDLRINGISRDMVDVRRRVRQVERSAKSATIRVASK